MVVTSLPLVARFPAAGPSLAGVRTFVRHRAEDSGLSPEQIDDLVIAATEAASSLLAPGVGSTLLVGWWSHHGVIEIKLRDEDRMEESPTVVELGEEAEFGFGGLSFPYILGFVDEYEITRPTSDHPGMTIRLTKETTGAW